MSGGGRARHRQRPAWSAAGDRGAVEARKVEEHLEHCEECAAVSGPLASMSRSLRSAAGRCVDVEDLADWEAGRVRGDQARAARIEAHLSGCATCRDDLSALREARRRASMRGGRPAWWLAAAAALILIGVALAFINGRWGS